MADEKETGAPGKSDVEPLTESAGIPWLPGRGNALRSSIDEPTEEIEEDIAEQDAAAVRPPRESGS